MSDPLKNKYKLFSGQGKKEQNIELRRVEATNIENPKETIAEPLPEERVQEKIDNTMVNATNLPRGIHLEDIDRAFQDQIKKDWIVVVDGKEVPIIDLTLGEYTQFAKTFQISDKKKNVQLPLITMVRNPTVQPGTSLGANTYMPPNNQTYTLHRQTELINGKERKVSYKIPQPTTVDIMYTVSFLCKRQSDLNKLNQKVLRFFQSRQYYLTVHGAHHMPILLETIGDASENSIDSRKYFKQVYEMKITGYIICEEDMEVKVHDTTMNIKLEPEKPATEVFECVKGKCSPKSCPACYKFTFGRKDDNTHEITAPNSILFTSINQKDDAPIELIKNGELVTVPFMLKKGDIFIVNHGFDCNKQRCIKLCGELID